MLIDPVFSQQPLRLIQTAAANCEFFFQLGFFLICRRHLRQTRAFSAADCGRHSDYMLRSADSAVDGCVDADR